jgi:hypothetical protein
MFFHPSEVFSFQAVVYHHYQLDQELHNIDENLILLQIQHQQPKSFFIIFNQEIKILFLPLHKHPEYRFQHHSNRLTILLHSNVYV